MEVQADTPTSGEKENKSFLQRYGALLVLISVAALIYAMGWHKYLSFQSLATNKDWLINFTNENYLIAVLLFALAYIIVVALSLPVATFLTLFGGLLFGGWIGGAITVVAATIGALLIFFVAKTSVGDSMAKQAGPWLEKLRDGFKDHALNYLLFLRLVPVFPFWLVNIAPALLGVKSSTYVIGTLLGIIPGTMAYSLVGAGLGSVLDKQKETYDACVASGKTDCSFTIDTSALITNELVLAFAALGVVALIPVAIQKFRGKKETS